MENTTRHHGRLARTSNFQIGYALEQILAYRRNGGTCQEEARKLSPIRSQYFAKFAMQVMPLDAEITEEYVNTVVREKVNDIYENRDIIGPRAPKESAPLQESAEPAKEDAPKSPETPMPERDIFTNDRLADEEDSLALLRKIEANQAHYSALALDDIEEKKCAIYEDINEAEQELFEALQPVREDVKLCQGELASRLADIYDRQDKIINLLNIIINQFNRK